MPTPIGMQLLQYTDSELEKLPVLSRLYPSIQAELESMTVAGKFLGSLSSCYKKGLFAFTVAQFEGLRLKDNQYKLDRPISNYSVDQMQLFWEIANSYMHVGRYSDALEHLEICIKFIDCPNNQHSNSIPYDFYQTGILKTHMLLLKAKIYVLQGQHQKAQAICNEIEANHADQDFKKLTSPTRREDLINTLIDVYYKAGLIEPALQKSLALFYDIVIFDKLTSFNLCLNIAGLYTKKSELDKAEQYLSHANQIFKELNTAFYPINTLMYSCIKAAKAPYNLKAAEEFIANFPQSYIDKFQSVLRPEKSGQPVALAESLIEVALFFEALGDTEQAIEYYYQALCLDLRSPHELGFLYLKQGKLPEAIAYIVLCELHYFNYGNQLRRILAKHLQDQQPRAVADIVLQFLDQLDAIKLPPHTVLSESILCRIADIFIDINQIEAARICLERATKDKYSPKGMAYFRLAQIDSAAGFVAQAIHNLELSAALGYDRAKFALIDEYLKQPRDRQQTIKLFALAEQLVTDANNSPPIHISETILELAKDDIDAKLLYARFLNFNTGHDFADNTDRTQIYKQIAENTTDPFYLDKVLYDLGFVNTFDGKFRKGEILELTGKFTEAARVFEELRSERRFGATATFKVGAMYEAAGNIDTARRYYEQALNDRQGVYLDRIKFPENSLCSIGMLAIGDYAAKASKTSACIWYKQSAIAAYKNQAAASNATAPLLYSSSSNSVNRANNKPENLALGKLIELSQTNGIAMLYLAEVYEAQGNLTLAKQAYLQAANKYNRIPAMLKCAQLAEDDNSAIGWYKRALDAGETEVAPAAIIEKIKNILPALDFDKLDQPDCLRDPISFELMVKPAVIYYRGDEHAVHSGISYELFTLTAEIRAQQERNKNAHERHGRWDGTFFDPKTQTTTTLYIDYSLNLHDIIPNKALELLLIYILDNPKSPVANYPGFINPTTNERYIQPYLTLAGKTVEAGHPDAIIPNKNLAEIMLNFPKPAVEFLLQGHRLKQQEDNLKALKCFLQAWSLAQAKEDSVTLELYPFNTKLHDAAAKQIAAYINPELPAAKKLNHELTHIIEVKLKSALGANYDAVMAIFTSKITHKLILDPVIVANGQVYESYAINSWFKKGKTTDPSTNDSIPRNFIPNNALAGFIPFLLLGGDLKQYPGFYAKNGQRFVNPYVNAAGETVEKNTPGAIYPNFWLQQLIVQLNIPANMPNTGRSYRM